MGNVLLLIQMKLSYMRAQCQCQLSC